MIDFACMIALTEVFLLVSSCQRRTAKQNEIVPISFGNILKATWIQHTANEGCNYEHVKCFESFLLQTFKHKDVIYP